MSQQIDTTARRNALDARPAPYFQRIEPRLYVGVRILATGQTWIARVTEETSGKTKHEALGTLSEIPAEHRFARAATLARDFAKRVNKGVTGAHTVADAIDAYLAHKLSADGAKAHDTAKRSLDLMVPPDGTFARRALVSLTRQEMIAFRLALPNPKDPLDPESVRRANATATRKWTTIKAALNYAFLEMHWVESDGAWTKLGAWGGIQASRTLYLTPEQRAAALASAEALGLTDLRDLMDAMLLTAFRPGELTGLNVADFDQRAGYVHIKEHVSKTGMRSVQLNERAANLLRRLCKDKTPAAPLFTCNGERWTTNDWNVRVKRVAKHAGLPPEFCLYNLRHTAISHVLEMGLDTLTVSRLAGTSLKMIDENYGHINPAHERERVNKMFATM
jgi:integrase